MIVKEHKGAFHNVRNILHLDQDHSYMSIFRCNCSSSYTLKDGAFYCLLWHNTPVVEKGKQIVAPGHECSRA